MNSQQHYIGAKLCKYLVGAPGSQPNISRIVMWSDSKIVFLWLSSRKLLQAFVKNRINKINQNSPSFLHKTLPSNHNPATTRGVPPQILTAKDLWFHGPRWLIENMLTQHEPAQEQEHNEVSYSTVTSIKASPSILKFVKLKRYSLWNRTFRITALIFHVIRIWREKKTSTAHLTTVDINEARNALIKATQQSHYAE